MLFSILSVFLLAPSLLDAIPTFSRAAPEIRQIFTFPNNTFIENIRVRFNGELLLTSMSVPTLFEIDPTASTPNASIVYTFPNATGLAGITETVPDTFAIVSATWDLVNTRAILGTIVVWTINLGSTPPIVHRIANVTNSTSFNGIASIPESPNLILAADSAIGAIWRVDLLTGLYGIAFSDPLFTPISTAQGSNLGINGLKIKDGYLHFTDSAQGIYGRVEIDSLGNKIGAVDLIANITASVATGGVYDDFALDRMGRAWIATHPEYVVEVELNGSQEVIANETLLLNPTSAAFGRGSTAEEKTLYVANGGLFAGDDLVDEGVVAVDVSCFG
ncbi:uncharacterized protein LY89DRAFT_679035 [Mollisia scopiformis]|uniref:SMP-30/Gluconolactonase/LRE-like region domain-containing protein n=1 Tax=Mollisia scopiformis TaxID=149040 RepID=A0A194XTQ1_MOLSC|nr:uncharacterized protein LY89DRAFT_679035 [Mollisia scopiformis]KUJ23695.1 hypothetical protein LY89DRAFT_679035 [Mollisia scopiformis]